MHPEHTLQRHLKTLVREWCIVANTGLVAALPLSLSASPKRKSSRRRHEPRRGRSFAGAAVLEPDPRVISVLEIVAPRCDC
jgi:hypothetical protein